METLLIAFLLNVPGAGLPVHVTSPAAHIDLTTAKVASIRGQINQASAVNLALQYQYTSELPGDRLVVIDSRGGFVDAGNAMLKTMAAEQLRGIRQICVVLHDASSMAFNFLTQCDLRLALAKAKMVMHKIAYTGTINCDGEVRCTARNLREAATELDRDDEAFRRANARALGMPLKDYDLYCDQEHTWSAKALLQRGYLSGIASIND